jgi:hypothetical protein
MSTEAATTAGATPGQEAYEEEHVHSVYEQIASHFSSTRYKVGNSIMFPKCFSFLLLDPSIHPSIQPDLSSSKIIFPLFPKMQKERERKRKENRRNHKLFPSFSLSHTKIPPFFPLPLLYTYRFPNTDPPVFKEFQGNQNQVS